MKNWSVKDFGKAAFAVGIGLTMGKYVGNCIIAVPEGISKGILKYLAKNGNEDAQQTCKKMKINYQTDEKEQNQTKMKIGFQ